MISSFLGVLMRPRRLQIGRRNRRICFRNTSNIKPTSRRSQPPSSFAISNEESERSRRCSNARTTSPTKNRPSLSSLRQSQIRRNSSRSMRRGSSKHRRIALRRLLLRNRARKNTSIPFRDRLHLVLPSPLPPPPLVLSNLNSRSAV